jgi:hypothetical protein
MGYSVMQGTKHVKFVQGHFAPVLNKYCTNAQFSCLGHSFLSVYICEPYRNRNKFLIWI